MVQRRAASIRRRDVCGELRSYDASAENTARAIAHAAELPLALKLPLDCAKAVGPINMRLRMRLPTFLCSSLTFLNLVRTQVMRT